MLVAVLLGGCVRAGFDSLQGADADGAASDGISPIDGACRTQHLAILTDGDDGEVDHFGIHLPQGEDASTWTKTDPDAIYIGYWVEWNDPTEEGFTRGYFRFRLTQAIPAHAAVTGAILTLHGLEAPESCADWNATAHALRVHAEDAADAPSVTKGIPNMIADSVRWPSGGGLAWKVNADNSVDVAPLLQALVRAYGGLAAGAHVQLWVQGDFTGVRAEVATPDIGRPHAKPARFDVSWCE